MHCIAYISAFAFANTTCQYSKLKGDPWRHNCDISARCVNTIGKFYICMHKHFNKPPVLHLHICTYYSVVTGVYTLELCICKHEAICAADYACVQRADTII
jgi:hypothetical protein